MLFNVWDGSGHLIGIANAADANEAMREAHELWGAKVSSVTPAETSLPEPKGVRPNGAVTVH